jgi:hypothetical protein
MAEEPTFDFGSAQVGEPGQVKHIASSVDAPARNTTTGAVLEAMIAPALKLGGYQVRTQVLLGSRPGGRKHNVDAVATKDGKTIVVSLKWQQVSGTAEQKVPFEVICLSELVLTERCQTAYLVLGGEGWTLRDFYVNGGLSRHLVHADRVSIVTLEKFIGLANRGAL